MLGYNRMTGYNKARYNAEGTELSAADGFSIADAGLTKRTTKTATELTIWSDNIAKQQNKAVTETIKLDAWLRDTRKDSNRWSD